LRSLPNASLLLTVMGNQEEGMRHYLAALTIEEQWLNAEPRSAAAKTAVSFSHSDIGFLLRKQGRNREAIDHFRIAVSLREELAAADPRNVRATSNLMSAYARLVDVLRASGQAREAALWQTKADSLKAAEPSK
jgi:tetratricopeptide (TPR) repeat protein